MSTPIYLLKCLICNKAATQYAFKQMSPLCPRLECFETWTVQSIHNITAFNVMQSREKLSWVRSLIKRIEKASMEAYDPDHDYFSQRWEPPQDEAETPNVEEHTTYSKYSTLLTQLRESIDGDEKTTNGRRNTSTA